MIEHRIEHIDQLKELWENIYNRDGHPDWSYILPYYDEHITFKDTVQAINGIEEFTALTQRLAERSENLKMKVVNAGQYEKTFFLEWEMTLSFKKYPDSTIYGMSRVFVNEEGKIYDQRDYYDLWGDIFDNIPRFNKAYRRFVKKKFG